MECINSIRESLEKEKFRVSAAVILPHTAHPAVQLLDEQSQLEKDQGK
ncbi:MAG: hypothetical protein KKC71_11120 [Chloroflexi bacterium]|nr:hypothetical protein [Chloroflexota bacterium]